jgi:radical SAM protein with 4Fe4S-binding SPASM domain
MSRLNRWRLLLDYLTRRTVVGGQPVEFIVETTAKCNIYCPMCPRETFKQPNEDMNDAVYDAFLDQARGTAESAMLIGLGEPLLDRKIFERITRCRHDHISALISTNGTLLHERAAARLLDTGVDHVTLSFDGATKEAFEFYRKGARFEKVRDNFVRFARLKHERGSRTFISVQMILMEKTRSQVREFMSFWEKVPGVDEVRVKADETDVLERKRHLASNGKWPCHYLWRGAMYIKHNGDVYPCCQSYALGGGPVGNLLEQPLVQIWNNAEMQRMRQLHVTKRAGEIDICRRCCTTIPHPVLVAGSLVLHGNTVRKLIPAVERLAYVAKWPLRLLRPPGAA